MTDLVGAARWLASPPGSRDSAGLPAALSGLPSDDPSPGIEVDVVAGGAELRESAQAGSFSFPPDEAEALCRGLEILAARGAEGAHALAARLLGVPTGPGAESTESTNPAASDPLVVRVAPALGSWLSARMTTEASRDGSVILRVDAPSHEELSPWLLRLGPRVAILSPRSSRLAMAAAADELAESYRRPVPDAM